MTLGDEPALFWHPWVWQLGGVTASEMAEVYLHHYIEMHDCLSD